MVTPSNLSWAPGLRSGGDGRRRQGFSDDAAGRAEILERLGLSVVRFTDEEAQNDLDPTVEKIRPEARATFD